MGYIIRYGERVQWLPHGQLPGCLNETGKARASALVDIFNGRPSQEHATFKTPSALFANHYSIPMHPFECQAPEQTLTPIAKKLGLPIIPEPSATMWNRKAGEDIFEAWAVPGSVVLVAWDDYVYESLCAYGSPGSVCGCIPTQTNHDLDAVYASVRYPDGREGGCTVLHQNFSYPTSTRKR